MSAREVWFNINKSGRLNAIEFGTFLHFVNIDLEFSEVEKLVGIFGNTISYKEFKKLIK